MNKIQEMTTEELTKYCVEKKIKGASFKEIINILDKNNIDNNIQKLIISKLDDIDKKQKVILNKIEKANQKKNGIITLLIGIGIEIFGLFLFTSSAKVGVVFIFNFVIWGFGGILILKGLLNILAGIVKK